MISGPVVQLAQILDANWSATLTADEWCFAQLCESVSTLTPQQAFDEIPAVVDLLLRQREPFLQGECGWMLAALARRAGTAQMPMELEERWTAIITAVGADNQLCLELRQWYRR